MDYPIRILSDKSEYVFIFGLRRVLALYIFVALTPLSLCLCHPPLIDPFKQSSHIQKETTLNTNRHITSALHNLSNNKNKT